MRQEWYRKEGNYTISLMGRSFSAKYSLKNKKKTNSSHLFDGFLSLRRLVGKATQEELSQLDGEVGEECKVSYNIRGDAL